MRTQDEWASCGGDVSCKALIFTCVWLYIQYIRATSSGHVRGFRLELVYVCMSANESSLLSDEGAASCLLHVYSLSTGAERFVAPLHAYGGSAVPRNLG